MARVQRAVGAFKKLVATSRVKKLTSHPAARVASLTVPLNVTGSRASGGSPRTASPAAVVDEE